MLNIIIVIIIKTSCELSSGDELKAMCLYDGQLAYDVYNK